MRRQLLVYASALAIAGCSETPPIVPPPAPPRPIPTPTPTPTPAATPTRGADWRDWPLTPGTWAYKQDGRGSVALYGVAGGEAELILRCDAARSRVILSRKGAGVTSLTLRTTSTVRDVPVQPLATSATAWLAADLAPRDPLLDALGYSRGRFIVAGNGLPTLVVPAYAEVLRVAEDCRG